MSLTIHDRYPTGEVSPVSPGLPIPEQKNIPDAPTERRQQSDMMLLQNSVSGLPENPYPEGKPQIGRVGVSLSEPEVKTTKETVAKGKPTTRKESILEGKNRQDWLHATDLVREEELRPKKDENGKRRYK
ncbi:hypothetical protein IMZ48_48925 [Candidatus Bathyarchaeota archaeon]|nr:hypothetical protein [Candidatus Bathyarchaeota archaeon]